MNLVVTPLYTAIAVEDVAAMIVPVLLPFNTLNMVINVTAGQVLLAPCMNVLRAVSYTHLSTPLCSRMRS